MKINQQSRVIIVYSIIVFMVCIAGIVFPQNNVSAQKPAMSKESYLNSKERRDVREKPGEIIEFIGVKPGMIIGEAGAGEGYFTFHLSKVIGPGGKIYANDIIQSQLDYLNDFLKKWEKETASNNNIITVLGNETDPLFPEKNLDMIAIYHSFHDFEKRDEWLANACKYLRKGGKFVIIDGYTPTHGALTKELVEEYGKRAGLKLLKYKKLGWHVHLFIKE